MSYKIEKIIRENRKTYLLKILDNGNFLLKVPYLATSADINLFLQKHSSWICKRVEEKKQVLELLKNLKEKKQILFLGKALKIQNYEGKKIFIKDECLYLNFEKHSLQNLEKFYKQNARVIFEQRFLIYKKLTGLSKPIKIKLSSAKTRWGSYSSKGYINLNWTLVLAPMEIIDYVIVHEILHSCHPNHSRLFWNDVRKYVVNLEQKKLWLRKYSVILNLANYYPSKCSEK